MGKQTTAPASDAGDSKPKKAGLLPRLSVPLTADKSKFAVENMTDPVRERLRAVLADPELRAKLALPEERPPAAAAGELLPENWDAGITNLLYEALGKLLGLMAARQGYTPGEAALLEFSDVEKSQLAAPTAAVLDKYFPGGLSRYGPEVVLAGALLVVMQGKLFTLRRVAAERLGAGAPGGTVHEFRPPAAASVQ